MISVGYSIPKKAVMVSSGDTRSKVDLLDACKMLQDNGYEIYATGGTEKFLAEHGRREGGQRDPYDFRA